MKKNLIIYSSKYGSTKKALETLKSKLVGTVDLIENNFESIDLTKYDTIIIASPIRFGQINKNIKDYITKNKSMLLTKNLILCIICGMPANKEQYFTTNFDNEILEHSIVKTCFGGLLDISVMNFLDKFVTKMVSKNNPNQPSLDNMEIEFVARYINNEI